MGTEGYFNLMAKLMAQAAPPAAEDAPIVARMKPRLASYRANRSQEIGKFDPATQAALKDIPQSALNKIEANRDTLGVKVNDWIVPMGLGTYGTNYIKRKAAVAAYGWPANQQDGCGLSLYRGRPKRAKADRRQQIHVDLRERRDASSQRLLVDHHVHDRPGLVVRSQSTEQVHCQPGGATIRKPNCRRVR